MSKSETLKKTNRQKFEQNVLSKIPKEEITELYLNQNCTYDFLMKKYGVTSWTLDKVIREYGIKKSRKQSAVLVLETKYEKAGSKEAYYKKQHESMVRNLSAKGITLEEHYSKVADSCRKAWGKKSQEEKISIIQAHYPSYYSDTEKIQHAKEARKQTKKFN